MCFVVEGLIKNVKSQEIKHEEYAKILTVYTGGLLNCVNLFLHQQVVRGLMVLNENKLPHNYLYMYMKTEMH